jgi:energy-coupling factor transport system permease protein
MIQKLDPRTKLVLVMCISSLAVFIPNVPILSVILIISIIISILAGSNLFRIIKKSTYLFSNIVEKLKVQGIGMVLISHDEDFVEAHADRIVELSNGRIMHDSKT